MKNNLIIAAAILLLAFTFNACGNKTSTTTSTTKDSTKVTSTKPQTKQSLSGIKSKSETITLNEGLAVFEISNNAGFSNFSVLLKDANGKNISLLANESGSYTGSITVKIPADGTYIIDVVSEVKWSVEVK